MAHGVYTRYVALGDSQTEGLWDGDDSDGIVGFADRLAAMLDALHPGLRYANLAIRGRRIRDVLDDQLPRALAMRPDLISICVGMNDITRPGLLFDRALADLDLMHQRLAQSGATVVTTTFPDIARIVPIGRILTSRMLRTNEAIRTAAGSLRVQARRPLRRAVDDRSPTPGATTGCTGRPRATSCSPPQPQRRSICLAATMIGRTASPTAAQPTLRSRAYSQAAVDEEHAGAVDMGPRARDIQR